MSNIFLAEAQQMESELISWRRHIHQFPEVGLELPETVAFVQNELEKMKVSYHTYEDCSCVVAQIGTGGRCFLLRADMDALPLKEESGEPFASINGCMHACGHDMHTTILLGAAKILKKHEHELKGTVKLLFQSGEEIFAGAKKAVEAGVLENPTVDAAMALHVNTTPESTIACGIHPMSSVYAFRIKVRGKGAHGSMPHDGIDPINTLVHIYIALQEVLAREVSAMDQAVLTIGKIQSGSAANILPDGGEMEGTLRTFRPDLRKVLIERIDEIVHSVSRTYRTEAEIEVLSDVPAVVCDEQLLNEALESLKELGNMTPVSTKVQTMGSEDFAVISEKVPSIFFALGALPQESTVIYGLHNPKIKFSEKSLSTGVAIFTKIAMDWLENHQ